MNDKMLTRATGLIGLALLPLTGCSPYGLQRNNNILTDLIHEFWKMVGRIGSEWVGFEIQAIILFGVPAGLCALAHSYEKDTPAVRCFCAGLGILAAMSVPLGDSLVYMSPVVKGWVLILGGIILLFLPGVLAFGLVRRAGNQRKLAVALYLVLAILAFGNLLKNCSIP